MISYCSYVIEMCSVLLALFFRNRRVLEKNENLSRIIPLLGSDDQRAAGPGSCWVARSSQLLRARRSSQQAARLTFQLPPSGDLVKCELWSVKWTLSISQNIDSGIIINRLSPSIRFWKVTACRLVISMNLIQMRKVQKSPSATVRLKYRKRSWNARTWKVDSCLCRIIHLRWAGSGHSSTASTANFVSEQLHPSVFCNDTCSWGECCILTDKLWRSLALLHRSTGGAQICRGT